MNEMSITTIQNMRLIVRSVWVWVLVCEYVCVCVCEGRGGGGSSFPLMTVHTRTVRGCLRCS